MIKQNIVFPLFCESLSFSWSDLCPLKHMLDKAFILINWNPTENACSDLAGFPVNDLFLRSIPDVLTLSMQDMHILSTDQGQVFAAVQEWNQNDTYNLYISDPHGVYFTLALENVKTIRGLGGNSMIDLYEVGASH